MDDIAGSADAVVVASTASEPDVFGHRDLHMVDIVRIPHGFEDLVGKAQSHDVLHRFLTQVVVDAEDRGLWENGIDDLIELARGVLIVAERFLNDDAAPRIIRAISHADALQLMANIGEELRGHGKVVGPVTARAAGSIELSEPGRQLVKAFVIEVALHKLDSLGQVLPHMLTERGSCTCLGGFADVVAESLFIPVTAAVADQGEACRKQSAIGQVIDSRQELLARQVTRDAKNHHARRAGDAWQALVLRVAQRVDPRAGSAH